MWPFISINDACVCWELSYWYAIEFSLIMRHNSCTTQSAEIFESTYMLKPDELLPIPARSSRTPRLSHPSSCLADVGIGDGRANGERTGYAILSGSRVSQPTPFPPLPRHAHTRTPVRPPPPSSLQERIRHTDGVRTDAKRGSLDPLTSDRSKPFPHLLPRS